MVVGIKGDWRIKAGGQLLVYVLLLDGVVGAFGCCLHHLFWSVSFMRFIGALKRERHKIIRTFVMFFDGVGKYW
jgi:hypothetical protein